MNGFARRYLLRIGCGLAAAALSFALTLHFTGAPVTYSKFTSGTANTNNSFTVGKWSFALVIQNGELTVSRAVYDAAYSIYDFTDGVLHVSVALSDGDFDPSNIKLSTVKLNYGSWNVSAQNIGIHEGYMTISFSWNEVAQWFQTSGSDSLNVTVTGTGTDGIINFSGSGTLQKDMPFIIG